MFSLWPLAERSIAKHIRHFAGQDPLVLIIVYPQYRSIIQRLGPALSVYYNLDDYSDNWPRRSHALANWEEETVVNADVTICIAQHRTEKLQTRVPEKVRDIFHLPLGCTPEFMAGSTSDWKIPDALRKIRRPMAGHIGALNFRFDFEFLSDAAEQLPDVSFVIGGDLPSERDGNASWWSGYKRARKLPNVHFIGWIEHAQLGDFLQSFDVLVMPYSECTFNVNACPAKLWDNLGSGRPIIANEANPETLRWREIVRIGRTPSGFAEEIRSALRRDSVEDRQRRLEIAHAHTWENLNHRLETAIATCETVRIFTPDGGLPDCVRQRFRFGCSFVGNFVRDRLRDRHHRLAMENTFLASNFGERLCPAKCLCLVAQYDSFSQATRSSSEPKVAYDCCSSRRRDGSSGR